MIKKTTLVMMFLVRIMGYFAVATLKWRHYILSYRRFDVSFDCKRLTGKHIASFLNVFYIFKSKNNRTKIQLKPEKRR